MSGFITIYYIKLSRKLCDNNSGYGAAQCNNYNVCDGSNNGNCYPNYVWSSTTSGSNYYEYNLNSGTFNQNYNNPRNADSVRCVLVFSIDVFLYIKYIFILNFD